jgi:thiopeptide-type bacteriocin biosynthesis protein
VAARREPLYRPVDVALLRAAAWPLNKSPDQWPDPADVEACRRWLQQVWPRAEVAAAIGHASRSLAERVEAICGDRAVSDKQVRRAAVATAGYLLRAVGRPTPFGVFAGVVPVTVAGAARVRWGTDHRPVAGVDTAWLADVIDQLERDPDLLPRLDVVVNNLAVRRGRRLEVPRGPSRVTIRHTSAVRAVLHTAAVPVRFDVLADKVTRTFPGPGHARVRAMLTELVRQGFLLTNLRAPFTVTDPLAHLLERLHEVDAVTVPSVAALVERLEAVQADVSRHNGRDTTAADRVEVRAALTRRARELSTAGRTSLVVHLRLDCAAELPAHVAQEMARAADVLLRLTRRPAGDPAWLNFHVAFLARYGTATLVPVTDVVDPDTGLGYPAGHPGSVLTPPVEAPLERDERLLALAWEAMADGRREVVLTEQTVAELTGDLPGDLPGDRTIPPHVEVAGRVQATSVEALERGDYVVTVRPARSAGTLTSRFTQVAAASRIEDTYRALPTAVDGAVAAQMSFPPAYPYGENVCRVPLYLPDVLSLGEHRRQGDGNVIALDDLAVTATRDRLHLVSMSRRQVVEPQVFHALALDKQPPPLARFLAHLPRAFAVGWHELDWGPYAYRLPYLPRVRYGRAILSPARWRLTIRDLPANEKRPATLEGWRRRWRCPALVELRDDDRTLRIALDEPSHIAVLLTHLRRHGHAVLTEAAPAASLGWLEGHTHEVVVPLVSTRAPSPSPVHGSLPVVTNRSHGDLPGSPEAAWLEARIYTHPERHGEIVADHLPALLASLDDETPWWFVRYRSATQPYHLRLRIRSGAPERSTRYMAAVGTWAQQLRRDGMAARVAFDTYYPESGRYGHGPAMDAALDVFVADSRVVTAALRRLPATNVHPIALTAANLVHIASGFLGDTATAWRWLIHRAVPTGPAPDRAVFDEAMRLAHQGHLHELPGWTSDLDHAWHARATALATYRQRLPTEADADDVLESLLHMHHNRALGIDPDSERTCRRLVRQAALSWQAQGTPR